MNENAYFKTYYKILDWSWFKEPRTLQVFIYLIARATIVPTEFLGVPVKRGQVVTSYPGICAGTGCSIQSARTSIKHLKSTGEITVKTFSKFSLITIVNYEKYQNRSEKNTFMANIENDLTVKPTGNQQSTNSQLTVNQHHYKSARKQEDKNRHAKPSSDEVSDFCNRRGIEPEFGQQLLLRCEKFEWVDTNGNPIDNWQGYFLNAWRSESTKQASADTQNQREEPRQYYLDECREWPPGSGLYVGPDEFEELSHGRNISSSE